MPIRAVLVALLLWVAMLPVSAHAAELILFEEAGCPWCKRWHSEVGEGYVRSEEGRRAPVRVVDIHAARPADIAFIKGVRATPTFVLVDQDREIGRIIGYPGADFFWGMLGQMMARLPHPMIQDAATRCPADEGYVSGARSTC